MCVVSKTAALTENLNLKPQKRVSSVTSVRYLFTFGKKANKNTYIPKLITVTEIYIPRASAYVCTINTYVCI